MTDKIFADHALSRRLERAEGCANAAFVAARAQADPAGGAQWIDVSGTYAMFDAPDSPITQTFGLGMFGQVSAADLDRIEAFFRDRGAAVHHEISPLADASVWPLIAERRYFPLEFTSVLFMDLRRAELAGGDSGIHVRIAQPAEAELWARTAHSGWSGSSELAAVPTLMQVGFNAAGLTPFFAEKDCRPIATGALNIHDRVALFAGASTVAEARNQGAQRALLAARLAFAIEAGCDLAAMGALPGSSSQRNAERAGFSIAYTRTKWCLPKAAV